MDMMIKEKFIGLWSKYFGAAELPIIFYYSDQDGLAEQVPPASGHRCIIGELAKVRQGVSLCYHAEAIACGGAKRYLGFTHVLRPDFEYFLSCGIPGKMEGERYIRTPEMVKAIMSRFAPLPITGKHIIFKRWDKIDRDDHPEVVVFFATPDVLSGLFTLAHYGRTEPDAVIVPFGAGCASVVYHPLREKDTPRPRAVIGMFDVSARPCVPADTLTFAVPMNQFVIMMNDMDESFLITDAWAKVRQRLMS